MEGGPIPDHNALVLPVSVHVRVTVVADGEYVRRELADFTILVQFDLLRGVNGQYLIRVHGDQYGAGVGLRRNNTHAYARKEEFSVSFVQSMTRSKKRHSATYVYQVLVVADQQIP